MSNVIRAMVRVKRDSKLGLHLDGDSQMKGYGNELERLAIQGLLYEYLVCNGSGINLSMTDIQNRPSESTELKSEVVKPSITTTEQALNEKDPIELEEEPVDLISYLGKYVDDSNFNLNE